MKGGGDGFRSDFLVIGNLDREMIPILHIAEGIRLPNPQGC